MLAEDSDVADRIETICGKGNRYLASTQVVSERLQCKE